MSNHVSLNIRMYASKPDPVMEKVILSLGWEYYSASKAVEYARKVLKKRWPEAESKIKKVPYQSYLYARHVIGGRWEEVEPIIAKCSNSAYLYAKFVLKDRFILAENNNKIWKTPRDIYLYSKYVLKRRWKEKEKKIENYFKTDHCYDVDSVVDYIEKIRKERWPAVEHAIVKTRLIGKYYKILKNENDKEEFYNKVLAESLVDSFPSWRTNYAEEFIKINGKIKEAKEAGLDALADRITRIL